MSSASITASNTILWSNTSGTGNELHLSGATTYATLCFCDFADNSLDPNNVTGGGSLSEQGVCIHLDPVFVDPLTQDYRPYVGSPCIDAGSNALIPPGVTTDLAGYPRTCNGTVDIGAYEWPWSAQANVSNETLGAEMVAIAVDSNGTAHTVWAQWVNAGANREIYYANSSNWAGTKTSIYATPDDSGAPAIAIDSNDIVHVAWDEQPGLAEGEIYYANSSNWTGTRTNISSRPVGEDSFNASIDVDSNDTVHVVWAQYNPASSRFDICCANSSDWSGTQTNISDSPEQSSAPYLAIDDGDVLHVTWHEYDGASFMEIFYANSTNWAACSTA